MSFDCFQTLVHTDWDPVRFGVRKLLEAGARVDPIDAMSSLQSLLSDSRPMYVQLHRLGDREACDQFWIDLFRQWAAEHGQEWTTDQLKAWLWDDLYGAEGGCFQVYSDVIPCLEELRSAGFRLAVVSNWDYTLEQTLEQRGLRGYFDCVLASLEVGVEKPDPGIFRAAERLLGLAPDQIVHIGDHPIDDYEGALRAGWHALLLDRSNGRPTEFSVVSSLLNIPDRIGQL